MINYKGAFQLNLEKSDAQNFIKKIYFDNQKYYSDSRGQGLLKVLNKIHSSHAYVAEIIQNSIDNGDVIARQVIIGFLREVQLFQELVDLTFHKQGSIVERINVT